MISAKLFEIPERKDIPYVLGAIILHDDGEYLNVVDGQQRSADFANGFLRP